MLWKESDVMCSGKRVLSCALDYLTTKQHLVNKWHPVLFLSSTKKQTEGLVIGQQVLQHGAIVPNCTLISFNIRNYSMPALLMTDNLDAEENGPN